MDVPTWLQAAVLGLVQGLTEFIPVSSSGHLVLVPFLLGWERPGLAFDVALHMGTATAIIVYFRVELIGMVRGVLLGARTPDGVLYRRLAVLLVLASVPVGIIGLLFSDAIAEVFENPLVTSGFLVITAIILLGGERLRDRRIRLTAGTAPHGRERDAQPRDGVPLDVGEDAADPAGLTLNRVGPREALLIGLAQVFALFPGVSRSGTTIMAGVASGLTREAATRFSFLMALPALLGAGILSAGDLAETGDFSYADIALGVAVSGISGYLAIRFLVALVSRERLTGFAIYVLVFAAIGALGVAWLGMPT